MKAQENGNDRLYPFLMRIAVFPPLTVMYKSPQRPQTDKATLLGRFIGFIDVFQEACKKGCSKIDQTRRSFVFIVKGVDTGMKQPSERPAGGVEMLMETYGNLLFRICLVTLGNQADAEDAVQDTFLRYLQKAPPFASAEHEQAWLIRVATNRCRDMLRTRHVHADLDSVQVYARDEEDGQALAALMTLPEKFRMVLTLHYVEGYRVNEIADMLGKTASAVKMRLQKGRALLEEAYRKE